MAANLAKNAGQLPWKPALTVCDLAGLFSAPAPSTGAGGLAGRHKAAAGDVLLPWSDVAQLAHLQADDVNELSDGCGRVRGRRGVLVAKHIRGLERACGAQNGQQLV